MPESLKGLLEERFGHDLGVPAEVDTHPELLSLARHRSCRRFRPDPLPEGWLRTLLACGLCVPSKSDLQQVSVVQVEDRALRSEIAALVPSMPWVGTAPAFLVVCGDGRRIRAICAERGKPFANDHLDALFNPTVDAALVLMGVLRAAEAVGLGGCPVSMLRNHAREVSRLLALPAWVFPVAGLALGWPEEEGGAVRARLPLDVTVHVDRYRDTGLPAALDA
jgi:nitroreductase